MTSKKTAPKFVGVHRENQWEVITYHVGTPVRPHETSLDEKRCPKIRLKPGATVRVQWPSGEESQETLKRVRHETTCFDSGHQYPVTQELYGIEHVHRGVKAWTDISEFKVALEDLPIAEPAS